MSRDNERVKLDDPRFARFFATATTDGTTNRQPLSVTSPIYTGDGVTPQPVEPTVCANGGLFTLDNLCRLALLITPNAPPDAGTTLDFEFSRNFVNFETPPRLTGVDVSSLVGARANIIVVDPCFDFDFLKANATASPEIDNLSMRSFITPGGVSAIQYDVFGLLLPPLGGDARTDRGRS